MSKPNTFYNLETIGGLLLFASAILAIIIANSPIRHGYNELLHMIVNFSIGEFSIEKPLQLWVNDGLMAIYFLLVGLEIKREIKRGILSSRASIIVPALTALSGLIIPALIYAWINRNHSLYLHGWAIPTATDIAFTLGIVSLLKSKVPYSLKIMLTAIAIFDDIGAIVIIAIFFSHDLSVISLLLAVVFTMILIALNYFKCKRISLYLFFGVLLWAAVLKSGVHATLAGIIIAMTIPDEQSNSILTELEGGIHPWVVFLILPLFAFANAGVSFIGIDTTMLTHTVVLGIVFGLFIGKQIGIFLPLSYFVKKGGYLKEYKTYTITLVHVYGIALICGVGFTMSLFIGSLAFHDGSNLMNLVKIGVVGGSFISALAGCLVFYLSKQPTMDNVRGDSSGKIAVTPPAAAPKSSL